MCCTSDSSCQASSAPPLVTSNTATPGNTSSLWGWTWRSVSVAHIKSVERVAIVEKSVCHGKVEQDNEEIEALTSNETTEIDVISATKKFTTYIYDWWVKDFPHLLWIFLRKKLTSLSRFSSWSSINLVVVPLPKNFISPPSIMIQNILGR